MTEENPLATDDTVVPENEAEQTKADAVEEQESTAASGAENTEEQDAAPDNADKPEAKAEGDDGDDESAEADKPKKRNRVPAKERIAQLTKQVKELQDQARKAKEKASAELKKPNKADFDDPDDYEDARALYRAKLADKDRAEQDANSATSEAEAAKAQAWQAQQVEARERYQDFDAKIQAVPADVFNQDVADAILESDMAADVAYVLATDLTRARELVQMTPVQRGRAIGRIEAELQAAATPKTISNAPPPVRTVGSKTTPQGFDAAKASVSDMAKHLGLEP